MMNTLEEADLKLKLLKDYVESLGSSGNAFVESAWTSGFADTLFEERKGVFTRPILEKQFYFDSLEAGRMKKEVSYFLEWAKGETTYQNLTPSESRVIMQECMKVYREITEPVLKKVESLTGILNEEVLILSEIRSEKLRMETAESREKAKRSLQEIESSSMLSILDSLEKDPNYLADLAVLPYMETF